MKLGFTNVYITVNKQNRESGKKKTDRRAEKEKEKEKERQREKVSVYKQGLGDSNLTFPIRIIVIIFCSSGDTWINCIDCASERFSGFVRRK